MYVCVCAFSTLTMPAAACSLQKFFWGVLGLQPKQLLLWKNRPFKWKMRVFNTEMYKLFCAGYVAPWSGRFYSLWDTGYAKIHIPIIASVSEHQPTTWVSFFFDLHILVCVFPAGAWFVIKEINDERVFSEFSGFLINLSYLMNF